MSVEPLVGAYGARPMTPEDMDAVLHVERASYSSPWAVSIFERELRNTWSFVDVVCRIEDPTQIVGHIVYWVVHDELHILNVAVHPDARRQGLARGILTRIFQICEEQRLQYVALEVRVSNEPAINLYRSFGFQKIGYRKRYYADNGEDALVLARVLSDEGASPSDA